MRTHEDIDQLSLALARSVVAHIDADPKRKGLLKAQVNCEHWRGTQSTPVLREWQVLLTRDWPIIRMIRIGVVTKQTIRGLLSELTPDNAATASHRLQSALASHTTL